MTDVPGLGTYKNEKMRLYKHYPFWKIGTEKRNKDLKRRIKECFRGSGKYSFKSLYTKYKFGNRKNFSGNSFDTGLWTLPYSCSIVDVTSYTKNKGNLMKDLNLHKLLFIL